MSPNNQTVTKRPLYLTVTIYAIIISLTTFLSSCSPEPTYRHPLGSGVGLHNSTIIVNDLRAARDYFADTLGFNLRDNFSSGDFEGTQSISTGFADFSSLQLLSPDDSADQQSIPSFITAFLDKHVGARLYSLASSSVDSTYSILSSQGFEMDSVKSYRTSAEVSTRWNRDDGGPQRRSIDFNKGNSDFPGYLPRFVEVMNAWYMGSMGWNSYYSFNRQFSKHPNGTVGISAIRIAVTDLEEAITQYKKMGFELLETNDENTLAVFRVVRSQEVHLVSSSSPKDDISDFLSKRGQGIVALRFEVLDIQATYDSLNSKLPEEALNYDNLGQSLTIPQQYAYGVQIEFVQESEEQAILAERLSLGDSLNESARKNAAGMYAKYCSLCHGDNREGYVADNAPSLRSHSLLATSKSTNFMRYTIQYGRTGTAMAGYLKDQGGPLEYIEIELILQWLNETAGVDESIEVSREPVSGDIELGSQLYRAKCAVCHGSDGEGVSAPALGNPMLLATATDGFLRHAISEGRDGTPMVAFKDSLNDEQIDALTAFLRTRASGWDKPNLDSVKVPTPDEYILNPDGRTPEFTLRDGLYVPAKQVYQALQDSMRIVILDARSEVAWRQTHIPGSAPVPYYEDPESFIPTMPQDSTWIVVYCACPHAASSRVVQTLRRYGFKNTAIIDEGILVWAQLGYPVRNGS